MLKINAQNLPFYKKLTWVLSIVIPLTVAALFSVKVDLNLPFDNIVFPINHGVLNTFTSLCLIGSLFYIKLGNVKAHNRFINAAVICSVIFLVSYVIYHLISNHTVYGDVNKDGILDAQEALLVKGSRTVYLVILLSHIALSAVVIPFVLFTYLRGVMTKDDPEYVERHRKLAKFTFPLWLYVSITGVIVFAMMYPYY